MISSNKRNKLIINRDINVIFEANLENKSLIQLILMSKKVITLTTDMGLNDHYVASLKGTILKSFDDIHIVDVSHTVRPFDISEAAYHVRSCYDDFPEGTVHVIGVGRRKFPCDPRISWSLFCCL
jgi:hypothetical protein